ncbi:centrosomal AT-AC splicing factor isoform X2 [Melopsittacus undulatus]|uniref:centrosomal AT-AC splicing factor isoform X2 n=1 Tax=Melopsittacus undulatus TaxID=13146 RepID=UPI00146E6E98|nr:coiled-coil domain-containing protein 84 isoform X2 [Melopsittacus undulatus]
MAVHYCALCRRSSFCGRRHLYSAAHRRRLREALRRLQEEVAAARAAAAEQEKDGGGAGGAALPRYDPVEHERRVWCPCCGRGVRRDGRRGPLALPGAALLQHVCGPEHRREAARFWREQRAEAALRERCVLPAEEYERYAHALERAVAAHQRREEERIRQMAADIREAERRQRETVRAALQCSSFLNHTQLQTEPEPCTGPASHGPPAAPQRDTSHEAEQPGPSGTHMGPDLNWMEPGQALTFIGHQDTEGKGNVHTGAKPPWLMEEEEEEKEHGSKQIGPSYEEFLKQKEKQKLKKLPPERVGANFDHTSQTSDAWLPSFGRVWNHGRRWQSRHQFRTESREKKKR